MRRRHQQPKRGRARRHDRRRSPRHQRRVPRIRADRQVRAVLLRRAERHDDQRPASASARELGPIALPELQAHTCGRLRVRPDHAQHRGLAAQLRERLRGFRRLRVDVEIGPEHVLPPRRPGRPRLELRHVDPAPREHAEAAVEGARHVRASRTRSSTWASAEPPPPMAPPTPPRTPSPDAPAPRTASGSRHRSGCPRRGPTARTGPRRAPTRRPPRPDPPPRRSSAPRRPCCTSPRRATARPRRNSSACASAWGWL